jgi:hypothetical protein
MVSVMLTCSWLNFTDMLLLIMYVVACMQAYILAILSYYCKLFVATIISLMEQQFVIPPPHTQFYRRQKKNLTDRQ